MQQVCVRNDGARRTQGRDTGRESVGRRSCLQSASNPSRAVSWIHRHRSRFEFCRVSRCIRDRMAVVDLRPSAPCARRRRRRTHRDCGGARRHTTQKVTHNARIGGEGSVLPVRRRWGGSPSAASSPPAPPASRLTPSRVVAGFNPKGIEQGLVLSRGERVNFKSDQF